MNLIELKEIFLELLNLLKKFGDTSLRYQINEIERAISIIESGTNIDEKEIKYIIRSIYRPKGTLAEFYVWDNDKTVRDEINLKLSNLGRKLWEYL